MQHTDVRNKRCRTREKREVSYIYKALHGRNRKSDRKKFVHLAQSRPFMMIQVLSGFMRISLFDTLTHLTAIMKKKIMKNDGGKMECSKKNVLGVIIGFY